MAADEEATTITFSEFVEQFRRQENNEQHASLHDAIIDVVVSPINGQSLKNYLKMDRSPRDEKELLIFDALVARKEIRHLGFALALDASCLPPLLARLGKGTLDGVSLRGMSLSGSQATEIVEKLLNKGLKAFVLYLREEYGSDVICPFLQFLQESSISHLALRCQRGKWIPTEALQSICKGVLKSSVKCLGLHDLNVRGENVERPHEILAEMILDSHSPIQRFHTLAHVPGDITLQLLSRALRQHPAIQNLDISFRMDIRQDDTLVFDRNPLWKRLLAMDDVPLNMWPFLLKKADAWKRDASHSHLDILYFLLKEKNTVLLQNVRRRRVRKRKRYGFQT